MPPQQKHREKLLQPLSHRGVKYRLILVLIGMPSEDGLFKVRPEWSPSLIKQFGVPT